MLLKNVLPIEQFSKNLFKELLNVEDETLQKILDDIFEQLTPSAMEAQYELWVDLVSEDRNDLQMKGMDYLEKS